MKIEYLKVRGAIGFKKGLGVDEIEFDLSDKSGLVALAGPNGRGKTTMLELMSPYRTFASRKGSLNRHFFLKDSFIETRFKYNGDEYQTIRKIDSGSDRAEAFIVVNGESVVNGKLRDYDKYIIDLFGSQTLFYNSVFCAQGSGNLSDMRTGDIKELFVEFLRIERLAGYEAECKKAVGYCEKQLAVIENEIEGLTASISKLKSSEEKLVESEKSLEDIRSKSEVCRKGIAAVDEEIREIRSDIEKTESLSKKKAELETTLAEMVKGRDDLRKRHEDALHDCAEKTNAINLKIAEFDEMFSLKEKILSADAEFEKSTRLSKELSEKLSSVYSESDAISSEKERLETEMIAPISKKIYDIENDSQVSEIEKIIGENEKEAARIRQKIEAAGNELEKTSNNTGLAVLKSRIERMKSEISLAIDPECKSTTCPAILRIASAKDELPEAEKKAAEIGAKIASDAKNICDEIAAMEEVLDGIGARINALNKDMVSLKLSNEKEIAGLESERETIKEQLGGVVKSLSELSEKKKKYFDQLEREKTHASAMSELAARKNELYVAEEKKNGLVEQRNLISSTISKQRDEYERMYEKATSGISLVENEITEINTFIKEVPTHRLSECESDKAFKVRMLEDLDAEANRISGNVAVLKNDIENIGKIAKSLEKSTNKAEIIKKEISEWAYLQKACSKTGLQALEIDGAAPLITTEANALLEKAFGLDSQIKIVTQDPESGREVFWIKVIREDGSEDDFGNLSGGQKVWIAKALSLGMTLVSKRKSGRNFRTLFADEEDGALDGEKALDFIQLYRSMMLTGDFDTCFYISHNKDVVAMADHVIGF